METFQSTLTKDYFVAGKAKYFPVAVFVIASITLMTIQVLCHAIPHHVPDWLFFAPFSVAAVGEPERYIYGIGMTLAALFFLGTLYYVYKAYAERLDHRFMCPWKFTVPLICVALVGLVVQAWVHLQDNILADDTYARGKYNWESKVHTIAAGVFFGLATIYCIIVSVIVYKNANEPLGTVVSSTSRTFKYVLVSSTVASVVIGFLMHPSIGLTSRHDSSLYFNLGGAFQWICVFSLIGFIATFAPDLAAHDRAMTGAYERIDKAPGRRDPTNTHTVTIARDGTMPEPLKDDPTTSDEERAHTEHSRLVSTYRD